MSTARFIVGDVFDVLASLEPGSVDLVMTSPPFLALRSYLPADHPDKAREIGSEATPGEFIDTMLDVVEACARVLAPHGSLVFELGDTYAGSGGAGGDYNEGGLRDGAPGFDGSARRTRTIPKRNTWTDDHARTHTVPAYETQTNGGKGWPLDKSKVLIPQLFAVALAYGFNPLTGRQTEPWRVRNTVAWCRPNPPVGRDCVDDQTEALTLDGWKRHQELCDGDLIAAYDPRSDSCRWLPAKFARYEVEGEPMVAIDKRGTSQRLTEDHRCLVRTTKRGPHVKLAGDLTNQCQVLLCAPFDDVAGPAPLTSERAELLGWYITEGSVAGRRALIRQSLTANRPKVDRIRSLLERDGADFRETNYRVSSGKYGGSVLTTFTVKGELAEWLNLHHKRLPMAYVTTWPEAQVRALFDGLIDGDGHRRRAGGFLFFQKERPVCDAVQVLATRLGYRASLTRQERMDGWQVTISDAQQKDLRWVNARKWDGEGIRREVYTGVVWCPSVETRFWLARRNGRTFITGNSDKFRPATSFLTVACKARDRYWDGDAVRVPPAASSDFTANYRDSRKEDMVGGAITDGEHRFEQRTASNPAGGPLLDWWEIPTEPFRGAHYATFPRALVVPVVKSMCPSRVCQTCGLPSRRITAAPTYRLARSGAEVPKHAFLDDPELKRQGAIGRDNGAVRENETLGWSDCDCSDDRNPSMGLHGKWRPGVVLDPFAGSGTTLAVATGHGLDAIGIDLDERNAELAYERIGGLFLTIEHPVSA